MCTCNYLTFLFLVVVKCFVDPLTEIRSCYTELAAGTFQDAKTNCQNIGEYIPIAIMVNLNMQ